MNFARLLLFQNVQKTCFDRISHPISRGEEEVKIPGLLRSTWGRAISPVVVKTKTICSRNLFGEGSNSVHSNAKFLDLNFRDITVFCHYLESDILRGEFGSKAEKVLFLIQPPGQVVEKAFFRLLIDDQV